MTYELQASYQDIQMTTMSRHPAKIGPGDQFLLFGVIPDHFRLAKSGRGVLTCREPLLDVGSCSTLDRCMKYTSI